MECFLTGIIKSVTCVRKLKLGTTEMSPKNPDDEVASSPPLPAAHRQLLLPEAAWCSQ